MNKKDPAIFQELEGMLLGLCAQAAACLDCAFGYSSSWHKAAEADVYTVCRDVVGPSGPDMHTVLRESCADG